MKTSIKEPCFILLGCLFFFTSISFLSSNIETLKSYDFLADVKKDSTTKTQDKTAIKKQSTTQKNGSKNNSKNISETTLNNQLEHFYTCLDSIKLKKKKIRIAHFGDSMIEGDLITSTLRKLFQQEFGGSGVGFINAAPFNASFRQTIAQDFSKNLECYSVKDKQSNYLIGLSGYTSVSEGNTWITLKSINSGDNSKLFYGKQQSETPINIEIDSIKTKLIANTSLQSYTQKLKNNETKINLQSNIAFPLFGLSVESDTGVIIDNFSFRGSSGTLFKELNADLLKQFQANLEYDLIILQFGINVAGSKTTDYSWYERNMLSNINFLKNAFPNTSFLIIGCGDRAVKYNGKYATSKGIAPLIESQKKLANTTQCGFLNFYKTMGGENSMVKWVTGDTCFANKDYTHFNHRGAEKAGKLIYNEILKDYKNWKTSYEVIY